MILCIINIPEKYWMWLLDGIILYDWNFMLGYLIWGILYGVFYLWVFYVGVFYMGVFYMGVFNMGYLIRGVRRDAMHCVST